MTLQYIPTAALLFPEVTLLAAYRVTATLLFKRIQLMCNLGSSPHTAYVSPWLCMPLLYQHSCIKPSIQPLLTHNLTHILHLALLTPHSWLDKRLLNA